MRILAFDGFVLSTGGYSAGLEDSENIGNFTLNPNMIARRAASGLLTGATIGPRDITATFLYEAATDSLVTGGLTIENAFQRLMGILDPTNDTPRTLTAELNDGTVVSCRAMVLNPSVSSGESVNELPVTFYSVDPYWREIDPTVTSVTVSENSAIALTNEGRARAYPTFDIGWTSQRTTDSATVGWKYMRQVTIENDTDEDWREQPVCVDLGDTAALVTGSKAQSDGDDLRVRINGDELFRTLTNWNTKRTFVHFLVSIKSGGSATYDVVYGNPSATTETNLSTFNGSRQTYIAYDLQGFSGTLSDGSVSTATRSGAGWENDQWKDGFIGFLSGTGSVRYRRILTNTSTVITFNRDLGTAVDNTTTFVLWKSGIFVDGGKVTAKTASTITDDQHTVKWGVNQLQGATVTFVGGSGATPATMTVLSNTTDTITFTSSFSVQPNVADTYHIERYGVWQYNVDTVITEVTHRGLYRINKRYSPPGNVWPGQLTPGAWGPDTYLENNDVFRQLRPQDTGASGGHAQNYFALLRAQRRMRQSTKYLDQGVGDGMSIYTPFRLQGARFDYQYRNDAYIGKFVAAYKEPAGEDWQDVVTNSALQQGSLTNVAVQYVDLDAFDNPTRFGMFALPADGVEVPLAFTGDATVTARTASTATDSSQSWSTNYWKNGTVTFASSSTAVPKTMTILSNTGTALTFTTSFTTQPTVNDTFTLKRPILPTDVVEVRNNDTMILYLDHSGFGGMSGSIYSVGAEVVIYDCNIQLRIGGGTNEIPPYDELVVGGSGHHLHLQTGEYLKIRCDPEISEAFAAVYSSSDILQYRAAWAVRAYHHEYNIDLVDTALVARDIMPVRPFQPLIKNYSFATDLTGWEDDGATGGVTATWTRDAGVFYDDAGSLKCVISAAPAGPWLASYSLTSAVQYNIVAGEMYEVGVMVRTTDTDVQAKLALTLGGVDAGGAPVASQVTSTKTFTSTGDWHPLGLGFPAPGVSTGLGEIILTVMGTGAAATGTVYFDLVTPGAPNLYITESSMGTITVDTSFREGWFG